MPPDTLQRIMSIEGQIASAEAELLYLRASEATVCIVEIGSFRGRSTVALALGSKAGNSVPVYSIDPHEQAGDGEYPYGPADRVAWMRNVLDAGVADIVRPINMQAHNVALGWPHRLDLLFIDGNHEEEFVVADAKLWASFLNVNGYMLLHDKHAVSVRKAVGVAQFEHGNLHELEEVEGIIQLQKVGHQ